MTRAVFLILLFITALLSLTRPIYTDETAFRLYNSRSIQDGAAFSANLFSPHCPSSEAGSMPLILQPARYVSSVVFNLFNTPFGHRMIGVFAFLWMLLAIGLISRNLSRVPHHRHDMFQFFVLFSFPVLVGVAPFLMVTSRPEPFILALIYTALAGVCAVVLNQVSRFVPALFSLLLLIGSTAFFALHPKALLFLPFMLMSYCLFAKGLGRLAVGVGCALLLVVAGLSYKIHAARLKCPEDQITYNKLIDIQQLTPAYLVSNPGDFFVTGFKNVLAASKYVRHIQYRDGYQVNWLIRNGDALFDKVMNIGISFGLLALIIFISIIAFGSIRKRPRRDLVFWIYISLLLAFFGICFISKTKNFYEAAMFLGLFPGLLVLPALFSNSERTFYRIKKRYLKWAVAFICINMLYLIVNFYDSYSNPHGVGYPVIGEQSDSLQSGFLELKNQCFGRERFAPGELYTDTQGYYAVADQRAIRMLNFAIMFEEFREPVDVRLRPMSIPSLKAFIGQCKWLEYIQPSSKDVLEKKMIGNLEGCCLKRKNDF